MYMHNPFENISLYYEAEVIKFCQDTRLPEDKPGICLTLTLAWLRCLFIQRTLPHNRISLIKQTQLLDRIIAQSTGRKNVPFTAFNAELTLREHREALFSRLSDETICVLQKRLQKYYMDFASLSIFYRFLLRENTMIPRAKAGSLINPEHIRTSIERDLRPVLAGNNQGAIIFLIAPRGAGHVLGLFSYNERICIFDSNFGELYFNYTSFNIYTKNIEREMPYSDTLDIVPIKHLLTWEDALRSLLCFYTQKPIRYRAYKIHFITNEQKVLEEFHGFSREPSVPSTPTQEDCRACILPPSIPALTPAREASTNHTLPPSTMPEPTHEPPCKRLCARDL